MPLLPLKQAGGFFEPPLSYALLAAILAVSALLLWRRYRSRRQLVQRVAELETLSSVGRAIVAAELDIEALCELVAGEAGRIIDNRTIQIGLFEGNRYLIKHWIIDGQLQAVPQSFELDENGGLVGWIRDSRRSLLVRDFAREMGNLPAQPGYISNSPPRSAIFVPLLSRQKAIGLLAAQSERPNAFSPGDLSLLTILANQAAAAVVNARMFKRERTRAAQLELVSQIARQVNAINDLEEVFRQVVALTQVTFGYNSVNIFGIDSQSNLAQLRASSISGLELGDLSLLPGQGLIGAVVATRKAALASDSHDDRRFLDGTSSADTFSELAIPLIVDEELLGVLDVQSQNLDAFSNQEQTVLKALADQVAIAIHKAQQFALQREQSWVATAQLQVAEAISQSPDLESLSESLVRLTAMLLGIDQCALLLWHEDMGQYRGTADFGLTQPETETFRRQGIAIGHWKALDAVHVGLEQLSTRQTPPWRQSGGTDQESDRYTIQPLIAKARLVGVLVLHGWSGEAAVPRGSREELLFSIAGQSAQAIDGIRLQLAQQEEAWVNTALLQVAEAVNQLTDLNEILYTIVRMVPMLVGVRTCVILVWDEAQGVYHAGPSHGLSEMGQGLLDSFEVDLSEFLLVEVLDIERLGPDLSYYTFKLPGWMDAIMEADTAIIFPLFARARRVGALVVGPPAGDRPLVGRRLNILTGIAQQAAIAVVNDQLYKESAERSRMEQELNVARAIQASLIPDGNPDIPGCIISSFWRAARQVSGDFYDFMSLGDNQWGIAIADVADKGVPAALFMALSRTILRTVAFNRRSPANVLERSNQIIFGDTSSDLFVTIFYAVWKPDSQTLVYASAGHNPPLLVRANGNISLLQADGIALGVLEDVRISQREIDLKSGDTVIFYTDGVTEAMNEDFDEFGLERLSLVAQKNRDIPAPELVRLITMAIDDHAGDTPQFDDVTLVVMKV